MVDPKANTTFEVFYDGESIADRFICGVTGWVTTEALAEWEAEMKNPDDDLSRLFSHGAGIYSVVVKYDRGQMGDEGRYEIRPHWEYSFADHQDLTSS